jgi:hypothetical protein
MKRHNPQKRSYGEFRADTDRQYSYSQKDKEKGTSKINPIFTRVPYSSVGKAK